MENIKMYEELAEEVKEQLEYQYSSMVMAGNAHGAAEILMRLVDYKMIEEDDPRIHYGYRMFEDSGLKAEWRLISGRVKLNKEKLPKWILADIPYVIGTELYTLERVGKRVEGAYECDMIYPPRKIETEFRRIDGRVKVQRAVEDMAKLYKKETGTDWDYTTTMKEAEAGLSRIYEIEVPRGVQSRYKNLGYVLVFYSVQHDTFLANIIIRTEVFKYYFIDIEMGLKHLESILESRLQIRNKIVVSSPVDYSKSIKQQARKIRDSNNRIRNIRKYQQQLADG